MHSIAQPAITNNGTHKIPEGPTTEPSPCIGLALEVLAMLELQQAYFESRDRMALIACKRVEKAVKAACQAIVATIAPDEEPDTTLFPTEESPE